VAIGLYRSSPPHDNRTLGALCEAAQTETRVRLRYRSRPGEETEREFDAYGLAYRSGCWYVVGWCHLRRGLRSFRLDRVMSVRPGERRFSRPEGFDALAHVTVSVAMLKRAFSVEVLLMTDLQTAQRELFPAAGVLEWTGDGVLLRGEVDSLPWFARELARLPFAFAIRRPASLRRALRAVVKNLEKLAIA
jgi:predicted DNA-binding transcriptional regulator YafY